MPIRRTTAERFVLVDRHVLIAEKDHQFSISASCTSWIAGCRAARQVDPGDLAPICGVSFDLGSSDTASLSPLSRSFNGNRKAATI